MATGFSIPAPASLYQALPRLKPVGDSKLTLKPAPSRDSNVKDVITKASKIITAQHLLKITTSQ
ncbi:hypothetical protein MTR_8g078740 [Medicago truncatula]|uniref:Uncharacterized protein n=1 Tax=Medicago truncatula TaxID=3880 RepID=A0A072TSI2_MEDTR|nr:hypothetical protein MTR_8g078740 [Medicago truncatula]